MPRENSRASQRSSRRGAPERRKSLRLRAVLDAIKDSLATNRRDLDLQFKRIAPDPGRGRSAQATPRAFVKDLTQRTRSSQRRILGLPREAEGRTAHHENDLIVRFPRSPRIPRFDWSWSAASPAGAAAPSDGGPARAHADLLA